MPTHQSLSLNNCVVVYKSIVHGKLLRITQEPHVRTFINRSNGKEEVISEEIKPKVLDLQIDDRSDLKELIKFLENIVEMEVDEEVRVKARSLLTETLDNSEDQD